MADSPDFYSYEIRGDRFTDFCVHTARLSGNRLKKVGRLEKIGQWDHGINRVLGCLPACGHDTGFSYWQNMVRSNLMYLFKLFILSFNLHFLESNTLKLETGN